MDRLILGCGNFGGVGTSPELNGLGLDEAAARALLAAALARGIRAFDTAHAFGGGASETILGRWLQTLPDEGELRVSTKIGHPHGTLPGRRPLEAAEVERQLSISLVRLKRERVDTLYLHEPDRATPWRETLEALEAALLRGQFSWWGLSNVGLVDAREAIGLASPRLRERLRSVQNEFHYLETSDTTALLPYLRARGISYVAYGPLAGGLLSGRHRHGVAPEAGSRLALRPQPYLRFLGSDAFARIEELRSSGETMPRAALRFVLGTADQAVIGPRTVEQLWSLLPAENRPKAAPAADLHVTV
jgi:aryl-alcohol dehydrogenase-like predicted oxidoreductase